MIKIPSKKAFLAISLENTYNSGFNGTFLRVHSIFQTDVIASVSQTPAQRVQWEYNWCASSANILLVFCCCYCRSRFFLGHLLRKMPFEIIPPVEFGMPGLPLDCYGFPPFSVAINTPVDKCRTTYKTIIQFSQRKLRNNSILAAETYAYVRSSIS